tara:strand:+ start:6926 stop:7174 length:249 start_codon:yes stop_codon:yes gene_type:complete
MIKIHKATHKTRLLSYLNKYGDITTIQAIQDLGNTRLAHSIWELKNDGYEIETENVKVNTRWGTTTTVAKYKLLDTAKKRGV